jgi:AAHS family 4-hydroxybenzoate transporter-like MFS transporter
MMAAVAPTTTELIEVDRIGARQVLLLIAGAAVIFCDGFDAQLVSFVAPSLGPDLHLSKTAFAPIFAANLTGLMIGALAVAPLADIFSRRWNVIACVAAFGLLSVLPPFASTVMEFVVLRGLTGLALGAAMPGMIAAASDYIPVRLRGRLVVLLSCSFSLGIAVCGFATGLVVPHFGWRLMFWIGGAIPLVLLPMLLAFVPESPAYLLAHGRVSQLLAILQSMGPGSRMIEKTGATAARQRFPVVSLFRDGLASTTLLMWLAYFCSGSTLYFLSNWLPTLVTAAKFDADQAAYATSMYQVGGLIGGFFIGYLVDRVGAFAIALTTLCAAIAVAATGASAISILAIEIGAFAIGFFVIGSQNAMNAYTGSRLYPTAVRATGLGWALAGVRLGGILTGSLAAGILIGMNLPMTTIFLVIGLPELVAALALLLVHRIFVQRVAAAETKALPAYEYARPRSVD